MAKTPNDSQTDSEVALIVRGVTRLARRMRAERPKSDVTLAALGLLSTLYREGPMPAADLARAERLQPQSLSRLIARLEADGLIARTPGAEDRRTLVIAITDAGLGRLSRDMAPRRAWLAGEMETMLAPGERETLAAAARIMLRLAGEV